MSNFDTQKVLLVGMGGLGCPAALALAQAGIGNLTIADPDVVQVSNLHRQPWYRDRDVGQLKVEVAARRLRHSFPGLDVAIAPFRVGEARAASLFEGHDAVIDGTDDVRAKFLLSDTAIRLGIPLVYGGVLRTAGQAMLIGPGGPCFRCLFEQPLPGDEPPSCAQTGVMGTVAGLVGAIQASLALSALAGDRRRLGRLVIVEGWRLSQRTIQVARAPDCPACAAADRFRVARPSVGEHW